MANTDKKTEPKPEKKGPSDSERIDAIIALLERNGMSLPKVLR
jgi:hypothetical protein